MNEEEIDLALVVPTDRLYGVGANALGAEEDAPAAKAAGLALNA
jgi:hypothetical protein